jgi:hypothetical protein
MADRLVKWSHIINVKNRESPCACQEREANTDPLYLLLSNFETGKI